jgi:Fe-S oxidoreductase
MHIVTAVLNIYTDRLETKVKLRPLDLTNENAEYFGPKTIRDFSWKDLLSFDSCTECRRCTDICPANAVGKTLDPREVILKLRDAMRAEALTGSAAAGNQPVTEGLFESGVVTSEEVWACTSCGACVSECPVQIDQLGTLMELRRYQTLSLGEVPQTAAKAIENVIQHGNPWGVAADDRMNWAKGLDIPVITGDSPQVEWLYWIGCAGAYDPANQSVTRSMIQILKAAGVSFAVMGKAESCSGEPVKRLGDEYNFAEIARSNVENLKSLKFSKLVTHCPHCFNTLKNDYREYGGDFEVFHHSQLIEQLAKTGKLTVDPSVQEDRNQEGGKTTYHDPCFLGRHNGEYEAPRTVLHDLAGIDLVEMTLSRETSSCCGMGGGNMWFESKGGDKQIVDDRLAHVAATGARRLVTGCSFCLINFRGALGRVKGTEGLEVMDVAQVVAGRLSAVDSREKV